MQRTYKRLSVSRVNTLVKAARPGAYADGDGLYLMVSRAGVPSWSFRFMIAGKSREMGLGPVRHVGLARARELARDARELKRDGTDPVEARRAKKQGAAVAEAKTLSFAQCARAYITAHQAGWRHRQHRRQWTQSLESYVYPVIGKLPVAKIDTGLILQALQPIWHEKPETASRVRGRIERVLDWATVSEYRQGENPARWKGHLEHKLPKKTQIATVAHHPALPYRQIAGFMAALRAQDNDPAMRALDLAILCGSRSSEVLAAPWSEFNLTERLWTIPAARMKNQKEHRVPLSDAAMAILERQAAIRSNDYVFAGRSGGGHVNKSTLVLALKRLGRGDLTPHGFRSTFSDWCAECTSFPSEVREMALAHTVGNGVENAYRRGDMFEKRGALAEAWAAYCHGGAEIIDLAEVWSA